LEDNNNNNNKKAAKKTKRRNTKMPRQQERQGGSENSLSLSLSLGNPTLRKNSTARRIRKKASGHPQTSNKTHMQRMQHPFGKYNKQWLVLAIAARSWTSRQQQPRRAPNPNAPSPSTLLHLGFALHPNQQVSSEGKVFTTCPKPRVLHIFSVAYQQGLFMGEFFFHRPET